MKTMRGIALVGIIGAMLYSPTASSAQTIGDVVSQVSQTTYQHYLDDLLYTHTGNDRGYGAQHDLARSNIYDQFPSFGLQTTLDPFTYAGNTYYNVIGVLPGTSSRSDQIYFVGAHYDSVGNPGADDNASGVAGVWQPHRFFPSIISRRRWCLLPLTAKNRGSLEARIMRATTRAIISMA